MNDELKKTEVDDNLLRHTKKLRLPIFILYITSIVFLLLHCALAAYQVTLLTDELFTISITSSVISGVFGVVMSAFIYKIINIIEPENNKQYHDAFIIIFVLSSILLLYSVPMIVIGFKINIHYDQLEHTAIVVANCQGAFCALALITSVASLIMCVILKARTQIFYKNLGSRIYEAIHPDGKAFASAKNNKQTIEVITEDPKEEKKSKK
ncbi:MAG: hypothetical protein HUJ52_01165 [Malacoplasma sp.]|nr:hypothetical protein [Malacoplasma sp.]